MTSISIERRDVLAADRIMAISEQHGRGIITALPVDDQIEVCERIIKTHPNRSTVLWARTVYLDLTKGILPA